MPEPSPPSPPLPPSQRRRSDDSASLAGPIQVGAMRRLRAGRPLTDDEDTSGSPRSVDQFLHIVARSIEAVAESDESLLLLRIAHRPIPFPEGATTSSKLQLHPRVSERLTNVSSSIVAVAVTDSETLVLAPRIDRPEAADAILDRVTTALAPPVDVDGISYLLSHRIGGALLDTENQTVDRLLDATQLALAETDPARHAMMFHPHQRLVEERSAELRADLRVAIQEAEIDVALQPAISLHDGSITSLEAFVRWNRRGRGPVASTDILEAARSLDLTHQLNRQLIRRAFTVVAGLKSQSLLGEVTLWINVTPDEVLHPDFAETAARAMSTHAGLRLGLKVRPSPSSQDFATRNALRALEAAGAQVAIGDFGVGFSDFAGVSGFPYDTVMLERALVRQSTSSTQAAAVLKLLVSTAKRLELDVVGQGVETEQQLRLLHYTGCSSVQGYLVQKPLSPDELHAYLRDWAPLPIIAKL